MNRPQKTALRAVATSILVLATATGLSAGTAEFGAWGFDLNGRDLSVSPGDDFFAYANGQYQRNLVIPPDRSSFSPRSANNVVIEQRIRQILEAAALPNVAEPNTTEQQVGAFYASFMDAERIEALGATPLRTDLAKIHTASRSRLAALMGSGVHSFHGSLFEIDVSSDARDRRSYAVYLGQGGLGLPDRSYYTDPDFEPQRTAYRNYAAKLLSLAAWPNPDASAAAILKLETRIALVSWTKAEQRDPNRTYNPMGLAELEQSAPGVDWRAYFASTGLGAPKRIVVMEDSALPRLAAIFAGTPLKTLRAWAAFRMADHAAPYLSRDFADAWFEMRGRTLSGLPEQPARWRRAVRAVSGSDGSTFDRADTFGNLGFAVGDLYVARYFPPEAKAMIDELVVNLKAAFRERIMSLGWMSTSTKAEALRKLDAYRVKVGYPEKSRDYSTISMRRTDLYGNVLRAAAADWYFRSSRLHKPVDRGEWLMTPQMNNAYNGPLTDIVFPAAILMPPIFDPNADPAVNYGAVGGVIGHELIHGFDDQGRKFDSEGLIRNWWTDEDVRRFEEQSARLAAQYATYAPLPSLHVNPQLTMGENIADLGGIALALDAYRLFVQDREAPILDGMTGEQRVMLGWAQAWRGKVREDALRQQLVSDPHSPRQYRTNGPLRNIDAWYAAFGVGPDDKLYVPPHDRVRLW